MEPSTDSEMKIEDERIVKVKSIDGQTTQISIKQEVSNHTYEKATIEELKVKI